MSVPNKLGEEKLSQHLLWYAVHTKARQEDFANLNLESLGLSTFNPKLKESKVIRGVRQYVVKPLFPGYLFCKFRCQESYRAVKYSRGVRDVVGTSGEPTPVDEEIITIIRERMKGGVVLIEPPRLSPGDMVMVEEGPLSGFIGIFEREMKDSERVVILLNTIKYQARVVMDRSTLRRI